MPTYRSDAVGSLLRPTSLKGARERYASGGLSDAEFKRLEDRAVNDAVSLQEQAGEAYVYLRARTARPSKATLISAQQAAAYYAPEKSQGAYPMIDAYLANAAK